MLPGTEIIFNIVCAFLILKNFFCHKGQFLLAQAKTCLQERQINWYTMQSIHAERELISDHGILFGNKNELITLDVGTNKYVNFQAKSIISFAMIV